MRVNKAYGLDKVQSAGCGSSGKPRTRPVFIWDVEQIGLIKIYQEDMKRRWVVKLMCVEVGA